MQFYVDTENQKVFAYSEGQTPRAGLVPCDPRPGVAYTWQNGGWAIDPTLQAAAVQQTATAARAKRDALLAACDYTQLTDSPPSAKDWKPYRQALRDLPAQSGFPDAIEWPTAPTK